MLLIRHTAVQAAIIHHPADATSGQEFQTAALHHRTAAWSPIAPVTAEQWGNFLSTIFDEWVHNDVGKVFLQLFDSALGSWVGQGASICIHQETCGDALALEHNGDLYSCDHFVEPDYYLGNIKEEHMLTLVSSDRQRKFGTR